MIYLTEVLDTGQRKGKEGGALEQESHSHPSGFRSPSTDGGKRKLILAAAYYRSYRL